MNMGPIWIKKRQKIHLTTPPPCRLPWMICMDYGKSESVHPTSLIFICTNSNFHSNIWHPTVMNWNPVHFWVWPFGSCVYWAGFSISQAGRHLCQQFFEKLVIYPTLWLDPTKYRCSKKCKVRWSMEAKLRPRR